MAKKEKGRALYRIRAVGISPMLQNPMTDETLDELLGGKGARKAPKTDITVQQRAEPKVCRGPNGEYGIPTNYLFACLVEAGREVTYSGKKNISTATSSRLPAFFNIVPDLTSVEGDGFIPFLDQDSIKWFPDKRRGVLKSGVGSGVAVAIVRPKFPQWSFEVTIEVDEELVNIEKIRELFEVAGRQFGLGDFRPAKKGQFGRFTVEEFAVIEQSIRAAA